MSIKISLSEDTAHVVISALHCYEDYSLERFNEDTKSGSDRTAKFWYNNSRDCLWLRKFIEEELKK